MTSGPAVILVGHGSLRRPEANSPILDLADRLRRSARFPQVEAVFLRCPPGPDSVLDRISAPVTVVVPVFAGRGHYTDVLIPKAFGLSGPVSRVGGRLIHYAAPLGCHPTLPDLVLAHADAARAASAWDPQRTGLLLIAHGSSRPGGSGHTAGAIAAELARRNHFGAVALGFLEQAPRAADWPDLIATETVVVSPLLLGRGVHASADIPPLFGLAAGERGPVTRHGRHIRLADDLGGSPQLADMVLDLIEQALAHPAFPPAGRAPG
jgi:sirohydrochlorin cobaltochelatase